MYSISYQPPVHTRVRPGHGPFSVAVKAEIRGFRYEKGVYAWKADADEQDLTEDVVTFDERVDARHALSLLDPYHNVAESEEERIERELRDLGDEDGDVDEEGGYEADNGFRAYFIALKKHKQDELLRVISAGCCHVQRVGDGKWRLVEDVILDLIDDGYDRLTIERHLADMDNATRAYQNKKEENAKFEPDESVPVAQQSTERAPNIAYRFPYLGAWLANVDRRRSGARTRKENAGKRHDPEGPVNVSERQLPKPGSSRSRRGARHESHCPKYGRQDERHQLPRREASGERRYLRNEQESRERYRRWFGKNNDHLPEGMTELECMEWDRYYDVGPYYGYGDEPYCDPLGDLEFLYHDWIREQLESFDDVDRPHIGLAEDVHLLEQGFRDCADLAGQLRRGETLHLR